MSSKSELLTCIGCLTTKKKELYNLLKESKNFKASYYDMLKTCFSLNISTCCSHICKSCVRKLVAAYNFRNKIILCMNDMQNFVEVAHCKPEEINIDEHSSEIFDDEKPMIKEELEDNYQSDGSFMDEEILPEKEIEIQEIDKPKTIIITKLPKRVNKSVKIKKKSEDCKYLSKIKIVKVFTDKTQENKDGILPFNLDKDATLCQICQTECHNPRMLRVHMNKHYSNFICDSCGKGFVNARGLKKHALVHEVGPFKCKYCDKIFEHKNSYYGHYTKAHGAGRKFPCKICNEQFNTHNQQVKHMQTVHNAVKKLNCPHCDKYFLMTSELNRHIKCIHKNVRNHKCPHCDKQFFNKTRMRNHMTYIHNIGERKHVCEVCLKRFVTKYNMKVHMKTHSKNKLNKNDQFYETY